VTDLESRDVSNWVAVVLMVAAIVLLVALAQGTPDHSRDRGDVSAATVAISLR
jgi:Flp pilus assembly protein protease CpaA